MSAHPPAPAETTQVDPAHSAPASVDPQTEPTLLEVAEEGQFYVDAIVVGATIVPGFVLCVPALAFIIVPVVALGLLAATAALVVLVAVAPVRAGWRVARRLRHGLATRRAPRALTLPRGRQPASPSAEGLAADATMVSASQGLAQEITSRPTTRSSGSRH